MGAKLGFCVRIKGFDAEALSLRERQMTCRFTCADRYLVTLEVYLKDFMVYKFATTAP